MVIGFALAKAMISPYEEYAVLNYSATTIFGYEGPPESKVK